MCSSDLRGDKDYWVDSIRGTSAVSSPSGDDGLPLDHPHYTRFTLWSLGTVREVNQENLGRKVAENDQRIDHFEIVSRALYKLVFYMDTRAVEVNDEDQLTQGQDNIFLSTLGCDANKKNMNNTSAFNALYIPACDVDPAGKAISLYEPLGIYLDSTEKVDYLDSRK